MTQELYINGVLADMDDTSNVWLDIKTNLLNDITKIQSSITLTIKLPTTANNCRIIGLAQAVTYRTGEDMQWRIHTAEYRRNGVTLIHNGRLTVVRVSDGSIECNIVWGLYDAVARLTKTDATLNTLTDEINTVLWTGNNAVESYADIADKNWFFADLDMWYVTAEDYPWTRSDSLYDSERTYNGGLRYANIHPSVRVPYVLGLIAAKCNVTMNWSQGAQAVINSLCLPLVDNKANDSTYQDTTIVSFASKPQTERTLGLFTPNFISVDPLLFTQENGTLIAAADMDIHATMQTLVQYDMTGWTVDSQGYWNMRGVYTAFGVEHGEDDYDSYYCGIRFTARETKIKASDYPSNIVSATLTGEGVFHVTKGEKLKFGRFYQQSSFYGGEPQWVAEPAADNPPTAFLSGSYVRMRPSAVGSDVPMNGYYPIESNLPNIKVIDFVKFLCAYTGSYPLQRASDDTVTFAQVSDVFGNIANAVDWSDRLIATTDENEPKELAFHVTDWAQRNRYQWQEDDRNEYPAEHYEFDLLLDDDTLEAERTVLTFPFAASEGNNVPVYTRTDAGNVESSACKPRVFMVYDKSGKAGAEFESGWSERLAGTMSPLRASLEKAKVITERIALTDIEVMQFDERKPVYLAQYGAFFAVLEIKQSNDMAADVTMLRIIQTEG